MRTVRQAAGLLALVLLAALCPADSWRFVVAGDGRSNGLNSTRPEDKNGVNVLINAEIRDAVLKEKAEALLWTGDLANGALDPAVFRTQLSTWREIMKPLWDAGVQVLPVRGNHECTCPKSVEIWNEIFSGRYSLPSSGPSNAKNLSYYAIRHNAMFVGIDQYVDGPGVLPMNWLRGILSRPHAQHVFVFGHEMAFMAGRHTDNLERRPADRDAFWRLLATSGCHAYFAGHDHFYDHMAVTAPGAPESSAIHQYVAGTAGAPFYDELGYHGNSSDWGIKRVLHLDKTYGYLLVEVDGPKATITFKGRDKKGKYVPKDVWTYASR